MKCPLCDRRKGKRFCPAKQTTICPQCCGEKRVVEIACPSDCQYLTSGQSFQAGKEVVQQLTQLEDRQLREKILAMHLRFPGVLHFVERIIVEFAQELTSLSDQDVKEATAIVLKRYRLEQKGLIYQDKSPKPFVESLAAKLSREIEEKRNSRDIDEAARLPLDVFITALEVIAADIAYQSGKGKGPTSYLQRTRRHHPEVESKRESSLIIPG